MELENSHRFPRGCRITVKRRRCSSGTVKSALYAHVSLSNSRNLSHKRRHTYGFMPDTCRSNRGDKKGRHALVLISLYTLHSSASPDVTRDLRQSGGGSRFALRMIPATMTPGGQYSRNTTLTRGQSNLFHIILSTRMVLCIPQRFSRIEIQLRCRRLGNWHKRLMDERDRFPAGLNTADHRRTHSSLEAKPRFLRFPTIMGAVAPVHTPVT